MSRTSAREIEVHGITGLTRLHLILLPLILSPPCKSRPEWNSDVKAIVPSEAPALGALKKRGNRVTEASATRATRSSFVRNGGRGEWEGDEQAAVAPTVDAYMQQQIKDLAGIALTHSLAVEQYSAQTRPSTSRSPSSSPSRTRHQAHRPRSAPSHVPAPPPSSSSSRGGSAKGVGESQGVIFTRKVGASPSGPTQSTGHVLPLLPTPPFLRPCSNAIWQFDSPQRVQPSKKGPLSHPWCCRSAPWTRHRGRSKSCARNLLGRLPPRSRWRQQHNIGDGGVGGARGCSSRPWLRHT